jgi:spermidine synthase
MNKRVRLAILIMGFSGLVAEIFLLREFLIVFSGNEFSIGIILANWLVLEAFGSYFLGRRIEKFKYKFEVFTGTTLLFSLTLLLSVPLIRILKGILGISIGESIGFLPMFYSSFLILLPVSVLHGALFTFSCHIYSLFSSQDASPAGRVYVYETVGTVIGGIACTYLLIPHLDTFQIFLGLALLNSFVCMAIIAPYWRNGTVPKIVLMLSTASILLFLFLISQASKLHLYSISAQWKNQNLVYYQNSQYGNLCVIENEGQYIFFQDGMPEIITPIPDLPFVEGFVHLPLLTHPEPKQLLILSGGAGGVINEMLRHPSIETVEYAELDPLLINLFRKFPTPLTESELNDERVEIKHIDGRLLLLTTQNKYDLIYIGITEPANLQANRFFTKEFFTLAREKLDERGILVLALPGSLTYMNDELKNLNSCIFHTLKSVFPYIRTVPGDGTNLFLVSDNQDISTLNGDQIMDRMNQRGIETNVMIPWYIEQKLHHGWQEWFSKFIQGSSQKINSDFNPLGVFYSVSHWNAVFAPQLRWLFRQLEKISITTVVPVIVVFLLFSFIFRSKRILSIRTGISLAIFTTGFAGMIFDLLLIFTFQSILGYVFSWIGILVASFMAGAACGALLIAIILERIMNSYKVFARIELAILVFSIGCPYILIGANEYLVSPENIFLFRMLFLFIAFFSGLLIGSQFPLANELYLGKSASITKTAGSLYASDLLGGWLGGIFGAVVLLPVLGLIGTGITVGLLKLTSYIVIATHPDRPR